MTNGAFDRFVEAVSAPAGEYALPGDAHLPPAEELTAIAAAHGIELLGAPGTMPED